MAGFSIAGHMGILAGVLRRFRRKYSRVRLRIIEGLLPTLEAELRQGLVDLYVGPVHEGVHPADLRISKLFDNERVVIGRKGHPLSRSRQLADLCDADWMTTSITYDAAEELHAPFAARGLPPPKAVCQCQSALSILSVLLNSDILAMVPQQWLHYPPLRGALQPILLDETFPAPPIMLAHRAGLGLTPAAEFLIGLIRKEAGAPQAAGPADE